MRSNKRSSEAARFLLLIALIAVVFVLQATLKPGSVTFTGAMNIARTASPLGIAALGQAVVILGGGIDLSVGVVLTLSNIITVEVMNGKNGNMLPAILISLALAVAVGLCNGLITQKMKIAPFITTLCTMSIVKGCYLVYTKATPKGSASPILRNLSDGYLFDCISYVALIWLFLTVIMIVILKLTRFGRELYFIGSSMPAARLSGVPSARVSVISYVVCSLFAGIAGVLISGYTGTSNLNVGDDYLMDTLACVLMGGVAITGGKGEIAGVVLSTYLLKTLFSLLVMLNLGNVGKLIAQGVIIFVIVALQSGLGQRTVRARRVESVKG